MLFINNIQMSMAVSKLVQLTRILTNIKKFVYSVFLYVFIGYLTSQSTTQIITRR